MISFKSAHTHAPSDDHGSSATPAGGGLAVGGCGDPEQGLRPGLHLEAGRPRPGQGRGQLLHPGQRERRGAARPLVGPRRPGSRPRAWPDGRARTLRPAIRPAQSPRRHPAEQASGRRPEDRGRVRPAAGRRTARHRRPQARTADRSRQAGPPEPPLLRPNRVAVQVHLDLPRLPRRERPPGPPGRRPAKAISTGPPWSPRSTT